jgi:hypothetical protein
LSRRDRSIPTATVAEEELSRLLVGGSDITIDRLDRLAGLLLATVGTVNLASAD